MPVPVTRAQIWWKWLDSNQRSPGGRALYRRVQLPLCDTFHSHCLLCRQIPNRLGWRSESC
jgi:hypothetical protein